MEEDWDLHAVVRGCCSTVTSTTSTTTAVSSSSVFPLHPEPPSCGFSSIFGAEQKPQILSLSSTHPFEPRTSSSSIEELHELCKPFFSRSQPLSLQTSPLFSSFSYSSAASPKLAQTQDKQQPQQQQLQQRSKQPHQGGSVTNSRIKRRKNQLKKVCQVPVEGLSTDVWAWRKYGQKPIKGSPYPRGYYRCSSSKGCLARKQVERNRSDPTMFIVTYTSEHNHPAPTHKNSLAGSTRQKPLTPPQAETNKDESEKDLTKPSSPATSSGGGGGGGEEEVQTQGEKSESREEKEDCSMDDEEGDEFGSFDDVLTDDFFENLDELNQLASGGSVDCFTDPFSSAITIPNWVANSAAATAAGGS